MQDFMKPRLALATFILFFYGLVLANVTPLLQNNGDDDDCTNYNTSLWPPYQAENVTCTLNTRYGPDCTHWRVMALFLFGSLPNINENLANAKLQLNISSQYCQRDSELQLIAPKWATLGASAACSYKDKFSNSTYLLNQLTNSSVVPNGDPFGAMSQMIDNMVSCSDKSPLDQFESGVVFIYTDLPCWETPKHAAAFKKARMFSSQFAGHLILHSVPSPCWISIRFIVYNSIDNNGAHQFHNCQRFMQCLDCEYPYCDVHQASVPDAEQSCSGVAPILPTLPPTTTIQSPFTTLVTPTKQQIDCTSTKHHKDFSSTKGMPPIYTGSKGTSTSQNPTTSSSTTSVYDLPQSHGLSKLELGLVIVIPILVVVLVVTIFCWKCSSIPRRWRARRIKNEIVSTTPSAPVFESIPNNYTELEKLAMRNKSDYFELPARNLVVHELEILGSGAFSNVYKGTITGKVHIGLSSNSEHRYCEVCTAHQRDGRCEAAVKRLPAHADEQNRLDFFHEIDFMKRLGYNVHIISMLGCVSDPKDPLILIEYCHHGDMLNFLRARRNQLLPNNNASGEGIRLKDLISFSWQISDGLTYLASKNFIHRDVAARNVLLTKSLVAKVSDFGLCRYVDSALYTAKGGKLPIKWMALESLKFYEYSGKSDVWAFGVCLFEIFSMGDGPYQAIQPLDMLAHLESGNRLTRPKHCPLDIYDIMQLCWSQNKDERPEFSEIRECLINMLNSNDENYGYLALPDSVTVDELIPPPIHVKESEM